MSYEETTKRERKARTPKICRECKTEIDPGTIYTANSEKIDGMYNAIARHSDCIEAADILDAEIHHELEHRMFLTVTIEGNPEINYTDILADYPEVLNRLAKTKLS